MGCDFYYRGKMAFYLKDEKSAINAGLISDSFEYFSINYLGKNLIEIEECGEEKSYPERFIDELNGFLKNNPDCKYYWGDFVAVDDHGGSACFIGYDLKNNKVRKSEYVDVFDCLNECFSIMESRGELF